jgi:hypothetical protein
MRHPPGRRGTTRGTVRAAAGKEANVQKAAGMLFGVTLLCALVVALLCVVLRHCNYKKQAREQQEMALHIRRDVNSRSGWKESQ